MTITTTATTAPGTAAAAPGSELTITTTDPAAASLKDLVSTASRDLSLLVRKEVELAKAELKVTATGVVKGVAPLLGALVFVLGAAFLLCFTVAEAWTRLLGRPLGFLVGAGTLLLLAGVAGLVGKVLLGKIVKPERTPATVKEDIAALKSAKSGAAS